jgi:hypothetical protein
MFAFKIITLSQKLFWNWFLKNQSNCPQVKFLGKMKVRNIVCERLRLVLLQRTEACRTVRGAADIGHIPASGDTFRDCTQQSAARC